MIVMNLITITKTILSSMLNIYDIYINKVGYRTAIIALLIIITISTLVDVYGFKKSRSSLKLIENKFLVALLVIILNISLIFNLGKILPQKFLGIHIFYILLIAIILKQMLISILRNILIEEHSVAKDLIFITVIVLICLSIKASYTFIIIVSVIYIVAIQKGVAIKQLIIKLTISRYGLLYGEDEYKKAMSKIKIDK